MEILYSSQSRSTKALSYLSASKEERLKSLSLEKGPLIPSKSPSILVLYLFRMKEGIDWKDSATFSTLMLGNFSTHPIPLASNDNRHTVKLICPTF